LDYFIPLKVLNLHGVTFNIVTWLLALLIVFTLIFTFVYLYWCPQENFLVINVDDINLICLALPCLALLCLALLCLALLCLALLCLALPLPLLSPAHSP
jgi:hypothetical protein